MGEFLKKLTADFSDDDIYFAPKNFNKEKTSAQIFPHLKAESIIRRLNDVCGIFGWGSQSSVNADGSVIFSLSVRNPETQEWIRHDGVGTADYEDSADARKSAESDAIKRAARNFDIGLEFWSDKYNTFWVSWDPVKRRTLVTREEMLERMKDRPAPQPVKKINRG